MTNNVQDESLYFIVEVQPAQSEIQDSGWDTIDDLKDTNLGVIEDSTPILGGVLLLVKNWFPTKRLSGCTKEFDTWISNYQMGKIYWFYFGLKCYFNEIRVHEFVCFTSVSSTI